MVATCEAKCSWDACNRMHYNAPFRFCWLHSLTPQHCTQPRFLLCQFEHYEHHNMLARLDALQALRMPQTLHFASLQGHAPSLTTPVQAQESRTQMQQFTMWGKKL